MEYSITGLRNSAATSRMMPMDSASRCFRCCDSACVCVSVLMNASGSQRHGAQRPARDEESVAKVGLAVGERLAARGQHLPARGCKYRMSGGSVPLHRGPETRIKVGLAGGHQAELQ